MRENPSTGSGFICNIYDPSTCSTQPPSSLPQRILPPLTHSIMDVPPTSSPLPDLSPLLTPHSSSTKEPPLFLIAPPPHHTSHLTLPSSPVNRPPTSPIPHPFLPPVRQPSQPRRHPLQNLLQWSPFFV
ncbi:hypothetical protein E2C01_077393 [Portunus trituberculatus]|uniref:Uncharacterized protein n=1 Tax=Portunus trituberculatus TaxID=210409 RepID=A0A5B7IBC0_PORTR|nr:hypothetical protein [Portunus trituberculatus]